MTTGTIIRPSVAENLGEKRAAGYRITVFHCTNAMGNFSENAENYKVHGINLPCSGITREVVLLKAFEAGADAVIVLACPEGTCHYLEGNLRAGKRVARVKMLLDEIGLDGRRLNFYNVSPGDRDVIERILEKTVSDLSNMGSISAC